MRKRRRSLQARLLRAIEYISANECIGPRRHESGERCVYCEIYVLAHAGSTCHHGCPSKKYGLKSLQLLEKEFSR